MPEQHHILSSAISDRGLSNKRPENEDSYLDISRSGIFAVADGVGGAQAGEVASQMAMEIVGEAFTNLADGAAPAAVMQAAIERSNTAIHQMSRDLPQLASMATTIVALHIANGVATIGHVGDSRLYRVDRDGNLFRETDDHSMVGEEVRAGRMTEEQAETHPGRSIISRALGAEPTVEVDLKTVNVDPGTAFLVCSDGITRHVADAEIKGVLTFGGSPSEVCQYLKDLCFERGAEDNLTAVVVRVTDGAGVNLTADAEGEELTIATARAIVPPINVARPESPIEIDEPPVTAPIVALEETPVSQSQIPTLLGEERPDPRATTPIFEDRATTHFDADSIPQTDADVHGEPSAGIAQEILAEEELPLERPAARTAGLASALAFMIMGGLIGFMGYHFAWAPQKVSTDLPQLNSRSSDIPLSTFEENRRSVDTRPEAYLATATARENSEDYYLAARAHLLLGDYTSARLAAVEARRLLATTAEETNRKVLPADLALLMTAIDNISTQTILKREIAGDSQPLSSNANLSNAIR